ncbi:hypothetical protein QE197_25985 (plasmid) [Arsenophonus nasoniae]|uniref:Uncharacterized protein n=1 Tax=Arsenophonus nasoniae TaxID=638 RepID=A0A4P7L2R9_9GAMM|nr:hypothetical protein [Arsenophonus nasoniae]QBY47037.1 hypothetical protein ArsFIN_56480 [Arsenophonus nasoniae]WGM09216.1 hypothetical protein QE258_28195 [Arsenophonus nasoniae]WGM13938.1 hypothetical protein QE197_25985 [Arsenophonus nasoniae]WGM18564.1 hypothetical protein QE193_25680 [Arsenophonus nasoniae]
MYEIDLSKNEGKNKSQTGIMSTMKGSTVNNEERFIKFKEPNLNINVNVNVNVDGSFGAKDLISIVKDFTNEYINNISKITSSVIE